MRQRRRTPASAPADPVRRRLLAALALGPSMMSKALAEDRYPIGPIRLVVPWPPGGIVDVQGRMLAEKLRRALGQPVVIDNRPGAAGTIGIALGARARPDGYTLTLASSSNLVIAPLVEPDVGYDPIKDLAPITQFVDSPVVLLVNPRLGVDTFPALVQLAKSRPGQLMFGSNGTGGLVHIAGEVIQKAAGIEMLHVPYKGSPQTQLALLGNEVQVSVDFPATCSKLVQAGKLKALLFTGDARARVLPDVPTVKELGYPDLQMRGWAGIVAPTGTPPQIIERLHREIARIVHSPELTEYLLANGQRPVGSTPAQFAAFIATEKTKWARYVRLAGVGRDR